MTDIRGVDVASFQGTPRDWQSEAGEIEWAGVKFTELGADGSRYVNPDAAADWAWLKAHRIRRVAYMFGHPAAGPHESVAFFVGELTAAGLEDGDMIALDSEVSDGRAPAEVAAWGLTVLRALHKDCGRKPIEYIDLSYAEAGNADGHGDYPLWITDPSSPPGRPRVPAPWTSWHLHQYSITSPIDRDVAAYDTGDAMSEALGKPRPPAGPVEHITGGFLSLAGLADQHDCEPMHILRVTAERSPGRVFPPDVAELGNGLLRGTIPVTDPMPAGLHLWLPR